MTQRERSRKARQRWQGLLAEQGRSGESVAAFCRGRQLCTSHFYWRAGAEERSSAVSLSDTIHGGLARRTKFCESGAMPQSEFAELHSRQPARSGLSTTAKQTAIGSKLLKCRSATCF